jgi:hypothetical protein
VTNARSPIPEELHLNRCVFRGVEPINPRGYGILLCCWIIHLSNRLSR